MECEDDDLLDEDKQDDGIEDNDESPIEEAVENNQDIINDAIIKIAGWTNVEYSYLEDDAFLEGLQNGKYSGHFDRENILNAYLEDNDIIALKKEVVLEEADNVVYFIQTDDHAFLLRLRSRNYEEIADQPVWYVEEYKIIDND